MGSDLWVYTDLITQISDLDILVYEYLSLVNYRFGFFLCVCL